MSAATTGVPTANPLGEPLAAQQTKRNPTAPGDGTAFLEVLGRAAQPAGTEVRPARPGANQPGRGAERRPVNPGKQAQAIRREPAPATGRAREKDPNQATGSRPADQERPRSERSEAGPSAEAQSADAANQNQAAPAIVPVPPPDPLPEPGGETAAVPEAIDLAEGAIAGQSPSASLTARAQTGGEPLREALSQATGHAASGRATQPGQGSTATGATTSVNPAENEIPETTVENGSEEAGLAFAARLKAKPESTAESTGPRQAVAQPTAGRAERSEAKAGTPLAEIADANAGETGSGHQQDTEAPPEPRSSHEQATPAARTAEAGAVRPQTNPGVGPAGSQPAAGGAAAQSAAWRPAAPGEAYRILEAGQARANQAQGAQSNHDLTLRVQPEGESSVQVRLSERAGELQVMVRTRDQGVARSLQQNLSELVGRLDASGFDADTWRPPRSGDAEAYQDPQRGQRDEGESGSRGRRNHEDRHAPEWVEEMEQAALAQQESDRRELPWLRASIR